MFLEGKQAERLNEYDALSPSDRASFTYRIIGKITRFLDDVAEVNTVLGTIPFKSHKKAFKQEHIDLVFDLLEKILAGLDVAPVIGGIVLTDDADNLYTVKRFMAQDVDGKICRYGASKSATENEIALNVHLKERITRLNEFIIPSDQYPEFRPLAYFDGLVETAEQAGLVPLFEKETH